MINGMSVSYETQLVSFSSLDGALKTPINNRVIVAFAGQLTNSTIWPDQGPSAEWHAG